jgi:hypothetical protein
MDTGGRGKMPTNPCDRYETPCDADEETKAIDVGLDRIEGSLARVAARLDRFLRIVRWGMLVSAVSTTGLMAVLVYVRTTD